MRTDQSSSEIQYGMSWSPPYARYLGISSEAGLEAAITELKVQHVRFSTEWSSLEPEPGQFDWRDLDRHLDLLAAHEIPVTLAIGFKTPRWPECSHPVWANHLSRIDREKALRIYLKALVMHVRAVLRSSPGKWRMSHSFPSAPVSHVAHRHCSEYDLIRGLVLRAYHRKLPSPIQVSLEPGSRLPP